MVDRKVLEQELLAQAPKQWASVLKEREKLRKTKSVDQRSLEEKMKELRQKYIIDPALEEIERQYVERHLPHSSQLICPVCGKGDTGNKMNGRPWCFKCNIPLVLKDKTKKRA